MSDRILALSLWRPWPWTFFHAGKRVENRSWPLPSWAKNVPIAMHATQRFDAESVKRMLAGEFGPAGRYVPDLDRESATGIVGVFRFSDCFRLDEPDLFRVRASSPWAFGPYCWVVSRLHELHEPIPCKGRQRLWRLPEDVDAQLQRANLTEVTRR